MKKVLYIIPGFNDKSTLKPYKEIEKYFQDFGFEVFPIEITWKNKTMTNYVEEFFSQFNKYGKNNEVYLLGFSYGAMISLIASSKTKIKMQFLCSLSPYFKEDLPNIPNWWKKYLGLKRMKDFEKLSFNNIAKNISAETILFAGTNEGVEVERRVKDANKKIKNSQLFLIEKAKHDISQDIYLEKIKEVIKMIFDKK